MTYKLTGSPTLKGEKNVTIVTIEKEEPGRYSYERVELPGNRTNDNEEVLIQAVLDFIRTELDPTSALVQAQAKLEETHVKLQENEQKLAQAEAKQTATDQAVKQNKTESDHYGKVSYALVLTLITEKLLQYGTAYKVLVDLIQLNREFTYNGEPASDFIRNGRLERDGYGTAWKYEPKEQNEPTNVAPVATVSTTATVAPTTAEPPATTVTPNQ